MRRSLVVVVLAVLYLLHYDFWMWRNPDIVLGLPVGLLYQLTYCVVIALALALLLSRAWNQDQGAESPDPIDS